MSKYFKEGGSLVPFYRLGSGENLNDEILANNIAYISQNQKLFKYIKNNLASYIVPIEDADADKLIKSLIKPQESDLDTESMSLLDLPASNFIFPKEKFQEVMKYFQWVYDTYKTEAAVLLLANDQTREWMPFYVLQGNLAGGAVTYLRPTSNIEHPILVDDDVKAMHDKICKSYNELHKQGWKIWGTIHSHCNFNAYHSGTDDADEIIFDGLHITIGNVRSGWSYSTRYMINGYEIEHSVEKVLRIEDTEELEDLSNIEFPEEAKNYLVIRVHEKTDKFSSNLFDWEDSSEEDVIHENELYALIHRPTKETYYIKYSTWINNRSDFRDYEPHPSNYDEDEEEDDFPNIVIFNGDDFEYADDME